jgi:hypothetical protein
MKYLKQFIIGSSFPVLAGFYYSVKKQQPKKTYDYFNYTMAAPLWFGIWNIISLVIAEKFNLSTETRFLLISVISSLSIMLIASCLQSYNFTQEEWKSYYTYIFIKYMIVWNIIIQFIEKNI